MRELGEIAKRNWPLMRMTAGNHKNVMIVPYVLGVERQIARFRRRYKQLVEEQWNTSHHYEILHEISTLMEDLEVLSVFMKERGHRHKHHKLWAQVRHHIRHDLRDTKPTDHQKRQTKARAKYLDLGNFFTAITYNSDEITFGKQVVKISDIKEYIRWVKSNLVFESPIPESPKELLDQIQ